MLMQAPSHKLSLLITPLCFAQLLGHSLAVLLDDELQQHQFVDKEPEGAQKVQQLRAVDVEDTAPVGRVGFCSVFLGSEQPLFEQC